MSLAAFEGVVEQGQMKLKNGGSLYNLNFWR